VCVCVVLQDDEQLPITEADTDSSHYNVVATNKLSLIEYESVLHVYNTTKDDHGRYRCVASNELGSDSLLITLDSTSQ